jgi:hypothetical protein
MCCQPVSGFSNPAKFAYRFCIPCEEKKPTVFKTPGGHSQC